MRVALSRANLALRGAMEFGIVAGLAWWGYHAGKGMPARISLGVAAPLLLFGFWGLVDFHRAGSAAEPLRLIQELVISGAAAVALYAAGQHILGWTLGLISVVHHILVYLLGETLLKKQHRSGEQA
jgi:hypothetical protein